MTAFRCFITQVHKAGRGGSCISVDCAAEVGSAGAGYGFIINAGASAVLCLNLAFVLVLREEPGDVLSKIEMLVSGSAKHRATGKRNR